MQHQLSNSMLLDITYAGNHGTRLPMSGTISGVLSNMNDPKILALSTKVLQSDINSDVAKAAGIPFAVPGFHRHRRAGAASVAAVPGHQLAQLADRQEQLPFAPGQNG